MALIAGEQATGGEVRDNDGRLIVVGPGGVAIAGGGGGTGGTVALDAATLAALETISVANLLNPHPVSIATALDISDRTARLLGHVTVDNLPATQPVSGSVNVGNFPATQAVTGPLTDTQLRASAVPVSGTFFQATQPVSGTVAVSNFPATQPVSGTVTGNQGTANTAANGWPAKITDGTSVGAVKAASTPAQATDTAQVVTVRPSAGGTPVTIFLRNTAGITAEALATISIRRGDAAVTTGTTYVPTAGKTFRLLSATFGGATTSALIVATATVRALLSGTVTVTGPERIPVRLGIAAASAASGSAFAPIVMAYGDQGAFDLPAAGSLGISHNAAAATYSLDVALIGIEY